jgi:hypothetical protein
MDVNHTSRALRLPSLLGLAGTVDDTLGHNYIIYVQYDEPDIPVILALQNMVFRGSEPSDQLWLGGGVAR